jgi:hypothetical protein
MASTHKSLRSGTANKRPTTSIADGQIALNTNAASPGLYFKDSTGASIIKIGPVHVGTTAPNVAPAGSSGNSTGEAWLDTSLTPNGWKVWTGAAWVNATPVGSATVQGLLELATDAETQAGSDTARAVTPAGLQSKVSDSTSTTSSTTIASSTAVKSAYDLANAALPKSGGTVTGNLEIGTSGSLTFEGATADAFETTLAVVDPTADRTITLPNVTGTVVTTGDTGTVTSTMILDGTILNADVNASAAIAGTKISPDFGSQNAVTTGTSTAASFIPTSSTVPTNGVYLPAANNVAISTNGTGRLFIDSSGRVLVGTSTSRTVGDIAHNIQLEGASGNTGISIVNNYSTLADPSAYITLARSRSSTVGGSGLVSSGDYLGLLDFTGNDGSSFKVAARIGAFVDGTPGASDMPGRLVFSTTADGASNPTERLRITSAGLVGVGTASPRSLLSFGTADTSGTNGINLYDNGGNYRTGIGATSSYLRLYTPSDGSLQLGRLSTSDGSTFLEAARIDSSGRLLVGTSTSRGNLFNGTGNDTNFQLEGTTYGGSSASFIRNSNTSGQSYLVLGKTRGTAVGGTTVVNASDSLGTISFQGSDGTELVEAASITTLVDGTPGANDMPGALVFSTTADGAASPTERLRIDSSGRVGIGTSSPTEALSVVGTLVSTGTTSSAFFSSGNDVQGGNYPTFTMKVANSLIGYLKWKNAAGTDHWGIYSPMGAAGQQEKLAFRDLVGGQDRMVITPAGLVGIGTTSPEGKLEVSAGNAEGLRLSSPSYLSTSQGPWIAFNGGPSAGWDLARVQGIRRGSNAEGALVFYTNNGGSAPGTISEKARIDEAGRLLVGTSTAYAAVSGVTPYFQLQGTGENAYASIARWATNTAQGGLIFNKSRGASVGTRGVVAANDGLGEIVFAGDDGTNFISGARIEAGVDGTPGANDMPTRLMFSTTADGAASPTERMRISANGVVSIGTTGTSLGAADGVIVGPLESAYTVSAAGQVPIRIYNKDTTGTRYCMEFRATSGAVGSITHNGSATAYNTSSDYRLKENVTTVTDSIARLQELKPSRFNFITNPDHIVDGFIAHEAQAVVPECVTGEKDAVDDDGNPVYQGIDQSKLVPLLTAALQEAIGRIETLEAEVSALKGA